jgi:hypothetical protein
VVLGGLIAATWNFLLTVFNHRLQRRVGARVLLNSLAITGTAASTMKRHSDASFLADRDLQQLLDSWVEHRAALATLPMSAWDAVDRAVGIAHFSMTREEAGNGWDETGDLFCDRIIEVCRTATDSLVPYAKDARGPVARWIRRP